MIGSGDYAGQWGTCPHPVTPEPAKSAPVPSIPDECDQCDLGQSGACHEVRRNCIKESVPEPIQVHCEGKHPYGIDPEQYSAPAPVGLSPVDIAHSDAGLYAPAPREEDRCAICGWPLGNCQPGDCSMRPFPPRYYDAKRARREYAPSTIPDEAPPTREEDLAVEVASLRAQLAAERERVETAQLKWFIAMDCYDKLKEALKGAVYCIDNHYDEGGCPCDCDPANTARAALREEKP